jgi:hypothetical protein
VEENKMQVKDKVWLKPLNNQLRRSKEIKECVIKKIGRKYIEVENPDWDADIIKIEIETRREVTKYSPDWELYFSKQELLDEIEKEKLENDIKAIFGCYRGTDLSLDQLRRIKKIIDEE